MILALLFSIAGGLLPRFEIVSANDSTVTYRELLPQRVAVDPSARLFHYKGCPQIREDMEWVTPAAATLRGLREHSCASPRKDEYAVRTERRTPHDSGHIAVLFLGNSLTYFNEMPRMTAAIGAREDRPMLVDAVTQSGADLEDLWFRTEALKRIWQGHWDYVVIQERGGGEAHNRGERFYQYVGMFADQIRKSGARPLLFMTWYEPRAAEQEALYREAARRANVRLLPVGMAWHDLLSRREFDRLDWDEVHPNVAGSYLIACLAYATVYNKPPHDLPFDFRSLANPNEFYDAALLKQALNEGQAKAIQQAAWRAVRRAKNP